MDHTYAKLIEEASIQTAEGAFLMPGGSTVNPMTVGWAQFGVVWGRPVCTVFVRHSRYTHELMEKTDVFTLSVPNRGGMREALAYCGKNSGRDVNKMEALGLATLPPRAGGAAPLAGCALHFECRIVFKAESDLKDLDIAILNRYYQGKASEAGDPHTIYFGEILGAYRV